MSYGVPARLAYVISEDQQEGPPVVFVMPLPDGPPQALEGSAALIWIVAAEGEDDVPAAVAEAVARPIAEIGEEVRSYLDHLVDTGLLVSARDR